MALINNYFKGLFDIDFLHKFCLETTVISGKSWQRTRFHNEKKTLHSIVPAGPLITFEEKLHVHIFLFFSDLNWYHNHNGFSFVSWKLKLKLMTASSNSFIIWFTNCFITTTVNISSSNTIFKPNKNKITKRGLNYLVSLTVLKVTYVYWHF